MTLAHGTDPAGVGSPRAAADGAEKGDAGPGQGQRTRLRNRHAASDVIKRHRRDRDRYAIIDAAADIAVAPEAHDPAPAISKSSP